MSFRLPKTVLRESAGSYVNGTWVAGARSTLTTYASCQPVVMGRDMQALPEGRRLSDCIKVYTDDKLQMTAEGDGIQPDCIVHGEFAYELVDCSSNQSGVINHYKYIAVKLFKFTSVDDWTSGATARPI